VQEPVGEPRARVAARRWLVAAVAVALVTAAQLLRQSGARTWDTIWAEDGRVYASDALGGSWATSLLRGYAGYVQVVPRLLALPLRVLPPSWWAAWLAVSAALVTSLLALYVYGAVGSYLASSLLRALLAITAAVSPAMWFEVNANVANLGWPLLFAAFWALLDRRTTRGAVVARSVVLAAAALTSTLAALYLPLALLIAWRRRRGAEICVTAIFGVALAVQVVADRFTAPGDEVERVMYGWSVLHCLPTQLVDSPTAATGTVMRTDTVRAYAEAAGLALEVVPVENDFFRFYRLRAA
jgi:hypothetical protein